MMMMDGARTVHDSDGPTFLLREKCRPVAAVVSTGPPIITAMTVLHCVHPRNVGPSPL